MMNPETLKAMKERKCERCRQVIIGPIYAIGRTFIIFYYCEDCWNVVADGDDRLGPQ